MKFTWQIPGTTPAHRGFFNINGINIIVQWLLFRGRSLFAGFTGHTSINVDVYMNIFVIREAHDSVIRLTFSAPDRFQGLSSPVWNLQACFTDCTRDQM